MCRSYRVLLTLGATSTIHTTRTICTREAVCIDCASPTTAHAARAFSVVALREANLTFTRALAAVCALSTTGTIATCPQNKPLNQSINSTRISIHTVSLWVGTTTNLRNDDRGSTRHTNPVAPSVSSSDSRSTSSHRMSPAHHRRLAECPRYWICAVYGLFPYNP